MITGYNILHLADFSASQLALLADRLPKGLTYRCYGGGNVTNFVMNSKIADFLIAVEGKVVLTYTPTNGFYIALEMCRDRGIPLHAAGWCNELYIFPPPTIWNFGEWWRYNFRKGTYYRELAQRHIEQYLNWPVSFYAIGRPTVSLPLMVNQNFGYKMYAMEWLRYISFDIDLHCYGVDTDKLRGNLEWYKDNTNSKIHFYEFNGLGNDRSDAVMKNTLWHSERHHSQLLVIHDTLGNQLGDILYFTLAANDQTLRWKNPPYLHRFQVGTVVIDELNNLCHAD